MTTFFTGLLNRLLTATRAANHNSTQRKGPLRVEKLEPRHQCAVEVMQEANFIVVEGEPDAGSLSIKHETGDAAYDDKIIVSWTNDGQREMKAFDLYKYIERGGQRWAVKNVEYVEFSGGQGKHKFWSQTKITSYLNETPRLAELDAAIYGEAPTSLWSEAPQLPATN